MDIEFSTDEMVIAVVKHAPFRLNVGDKISHYLIIKNCNPVHLKKVESLINKKILIVGEVYISELFDQAVTLRLIASH